MHRSSTKRQRAHALLVSREADAPVALAPSGVSVSHPEGETRRARTGGVPGEEHPTHRMSMPKKSSRPDAEIGHTSVQRRDATETIARGSLYATGAPGLPLPGSPSQYTCSARRFCAVGMGNLRL